MRRRAWLFGVLSAGPIVAIQPADAQQPRQFRWSLVVSGAFHPHTRWGTALANALRSGNLDGDPCGNIGEILCQAATQPDIDDQPLASHVALGLRVSRRLELALSYASASAGSVSGYFDGGNSGTSGSDATLWLEMRARTLALTARYFLTSAIRIGGGPAVRLQETSTTTAGWFKAGGDTDKHTTVRPGILLEGSVTWPPRSTFFVELAARYSWAGGATFGPYDALNEQHQLRTTMPATTASFAHFVAGIGVGVRFPGK